MKQDQQFKRMVLPLNFKSMASLMLFLIAMLMPQDVLADNQTLVLWLKNGQKVYYELSEEPHTTFENGMLVIATNTVRVEYQRSKVLRYTYEGDRTDIESTSFNGFGFKQNGDDIYVYGLEQGTAAKLYNINGVLLETQKTNSLNKLHFSLHNLPSGTYIINVGDQNLKFMKR